MILLSKGNIFADFKINTNVTYHPTCKIYDVTHVFGKYTTNNHDHRVFDESKAVWDIDRFCTEWCVA